MRIKQGGDIAVSGIGLKDIFTYKFLKLATFEKMILCWVLFL